jgi:hypothetical protein
VFVVSCEAVRLLGLRPRFARRLRQRRIEKEQRFTPAPPPENTSERTKITP